MANKKFAQMSTKKLNALLENASEEDAIAIKQVLEARGQVASGENPQSAETVSTYVELSPEEKAAKAAAAAGEADNSLSEEEKAAIAAAEAGEAAEATKAEKKVKKEPKPKAPKLTDEELSAIYEQIVPNVGHECSIVLRGTAIRGNGYITGVLKEKRAMQLYYRIKLYETETDEAKFVFKKYNDESLNISEEIAEEYTASSNTGEAKKRKTRTDKVPQMTDDQWAQYKESMRAVIANHVGKKITLKNGLVGRIKDVLFDSRTQGTYFACQVVVDGVNKTKYQVVHYTVDELGAYIIDTDQIDETVDEEFTKLNEAFRNRKVVEKRNPKRTPAEKVAYLQEQVRKAEDTLKKAQETLESRKNELAIAESQLKNLQDCEQKGVEHDVNTVLNNEAEAEAAEAKAAEAETTGEELA